MFPSSPTSGMQLWRLHSRGGTSSQGWLDGVEFFVSSYGLESLAAAELVDLGHDGIGVLSALSGCLGGNRRGGCRGLLRGCRGGQCG